MLTFFFSLNNSRNFSKKVFPTLLLSFSQSRNRVKYKYCKTCSTTLSGNRLSEKLKTMTGRVWICSSMKFIFPWMYFFKVQDSDFLLPAQKKAVALIDLIGLGKLDSFLIKLKKYIRSRLSLFRVWDKEICWNFSPYADREICSSVWKPQPPLLIGFCSHLWIRGLELLKSVGVNHWRIGPSGWTDLEKF